MKTETMFEKIKYLFVHSPSRKMLKKQKEIAILLEGISYKMMKHLEDAKKEIKIDD